MMGNRGTEAGRIGIVLSAVFLAAATCTGGCSPGQNGEPAEDSSRDTVADVGKDVVGALNACHDGAGRYPPSLEDLVPNHLDEVPPPAGAGSSWEYQVGPEGAEFTLSYDGRKSGDHLHAYDSKTRMWFKSAR